MMFMQPYLRSAPSFEVKYTELGFLHKPRNSQGAYAQTRHDKAGKDS